MLIAGLTFVIGFGRIASAEDMPPYKDPTRPIDERVQDILARMTLEEKIEQMGGEFPGEVEENGWGMSNTPDNERLGIPGFRFTDGPRGVR